MRYLPRQHLRKPREFEALRHSGIRRDCDCFFLKLQTFPERQPPLRRLGVVASRRVGNAVRRNRAKRLLREAFRQNQHRLPPSCDLVLVARPAILQRSFAEIDSRLQLALRHTGSVLP